jgi:oligoribonuclease NrnB/cAMP/cGMP phosphodiesterase (DHH superfamily)
MGTPGPLWIHYHRDFDGMVSAAVLATLLAETGRERGARWRSVNYDQRTHWASFGEGQRLAIVDFHFHPRAEYWFDHHPTTFLSEELRAQYAPSERWQWDVDSPSCPPLILGHAGRHFGYRTPERFAEMARWSDVVDAARYRDVEEAVFGDQAALRIARALSVAPNDDWLDELVGALASGTLEEVAARPDLEKAFQRAARNRDKALSQFPPTVESTTDGVVVYDASSNQIRRERFAPFYHHPKAHYAVGVIPTRAGYHVSCGENPWNPPPVDVHIGRLMERYGGGGHRSVGGANPRDLAAARAAVGEVAEVLRSALRDGRAVAPKSAGAEHGGDAG